MEVAVSALRAELKQWIERAREGEDIIVTERGVPVARLTAVAGSDVIADLLREGALSAPEGARGEIARGDAPTDVVPDRSRPAAKQSAVSGLVRRLRR